MVEYFLRTVSRDDEELLFKWVNDEMARDASFSSATIDYSEHQKWFNDLLSSVSRRCYLLTDGRRDYGVIRFDYDEVYESAQISYSIDAKHRNKGLGKKIVTLGIKKILEDAPTLGNVTALVKNNNIASARIFNSLGFVCVEDSGRKDAVLFVAEKTHMMGLAQ
jgi:RimJ/RimL family protein N-acetyltransferase